MPTLKAYGGVNVQLHSFLKSVLEGCEWSNLRPGRITPRAKNIQHQLNEKLGESQSRPGGFREDLSLQITSTD